MRRARPRGPAHTRYRPASQRLARRAALSPCTRDKPSLVTSAYRLLCEYDVVGLPLAATCAPSPPCGASVEGTAHTAAQ